MTDQPLQKLYVKLRSNQRLNVFVMLTRLLVGFAFIPSGLKKVLAQRFTQISTDHPIGYFFEALYQTGNYWVFLGLAQLVTAFLLMTQRFATLGAVLFFCITINIWMITLALHFQGTWVITSLMMMAAVMLLLWDLRKLKMLVAPDNFDYRHPAEVYPTYNKYWSIAGLFIFVASLGILLMP